VTAPDHGNDQARAETEIGIGHPQGKPVVPIPPPIGVWT
jgi:hypothetical protein